MKAPKISITQRELGLKKRDLDTARFSEGKIPATLYGKSIQIKSDEGERSFPIFVDTKSSPMSLMSKGKMVKIDWNGRPVLATIKQVQREPVSQRPIHMSFQAVKNNEMISTELALNFTGEALGDKSGGILFIQKDRVSISAEAGKVPETLDLDISHLDVGESLTLADLKLPAGVELTEDDFTTPVIVCRPPKKEEEMESELVVGTESETEVLTSKTEE